MEKCDFHAKIGWLDGDAREVGTTNQGKRANPWPSAARTAGFSDQTIRTVSENARNAPDA
jgi:hypothetical protein